MDEIKQEIERIAKHCIEPKITIRWTTDETRYVIDAALNRAVIKTGNPHYALFAINSIELSWKSGNALACIGEHSPFFEKRIVRLKQLPEKMQPKDVGIKLLKLGYNALMLSSLPGDEWIESLKALGIKIIDPPYTVQSLQQKQSRGASDHGLTFMDSIIDEIQQLSVHTQKGDILYFPYSNGSQIQNQKHFWETLVDETPPGRYFAFPSVSSIENNCVSAAHPLLMHYLPSNNDINVLPIVDLDELAGKGLWPIVLEEFLESNFTTMRSNRFKGAIVACTALPTEQGLSHCNLWVAGQKLWNPFRSSESLITQWFQAHRNMDYLSVQTALKYFLYLHKELHSREERSYDQWKTFLEYAFVSLKFIDQQLENSSLNEEMHHAYVDTRRMLFDLMQKHQIPLAQTVEDKDLKGGFWTSLKASPGQTVRSGASVHYHTLPERQLFTPEMESIYQQNRC